MKSNNKAAVLEDHTEENAIKIVPRANIFYRFIKRAFDVAASLLGLLLVSPILLIVMLAIVIELRESES